MILVRYFFAVMGLLLLASCKDAKPQLTSILGSGKMPSTGSSQTPWSGRVTGGSDETIGVGVVGATTYAVRGRVALTPQNISGTATQSGKTYRIRGRVEL
jgi:hypothetical protein